MKSITKQGGRWVDGVAAGVTLRDIEDSPTSSGDIVASMCRHPKLIKYYTDEHNVDEDLRTIAKQGARYEDPDYAGVFKRNLNRNEFYLASSVASSNMKNMKLYG